jgi:hypothetical protein
VSASLFEDKPRAERRHEEDDLQRSVVDFLEIALPVDGVCFAVPNGGMRSKRAAARLRGMGVVAGVPDLEVIYRARAIFIELKTKQGTRSSEQRAMERRLLYAGADVFLCRSIPEVETALRGIGIPLRATSVAA